VGSCCILSCICRSPDAGWSRQGTWSSLLAGYWRAVAATRLVGADSWVLGGVGGALAAGFYLGTSGQLLHPVLYIYADPRMLDGVGRALVAASYLDNGGLLLLPVL
jgi:hypothetical protein